MGPTIVIEARLSAIDVAVVAKFLIVRGILPQTQSKLVSTAVALAAASIRATGFETDFTVEGALEFLYSCGLFKSSEGRMDRNRQQIDDVVRDSGLMPVTPGSQNRVAQALEIFSNKKG